MNCIDRKYRNLKEQSSINRAIQEVNRNLKKMSDGNLNKETLRRYQDMKDRIQNLVELKQKQFENVKEIKSFISIIEMQRNDIVLRTYKQVYFLIDIYI